MLISLLVILTIVAIGTGLTTWMSDRLRFEERLAIGTVAGVLAVSVTNLLAFIAIGMGWGSLALGLLLPGAAALLGAQRSANVLRSDVRSMWRRLRLPAAHGSSLRPFVIVTAASAAVTTRILSLSYQSTSDGMSAGSLAVWGDWSAHLAYAGSFAYGDNRGFDLPIASGHGFRYHFLADFFGAMFTVSGSTLPQALVLSEWLLAIALPPLLWCAVMRLVRSQLTAGLTLVLFTLSGGLGIWYFAVDVDRGGWSIISSLPRTYSRIPDAHLWVDNTISASLYAQRPTLMGLSVGFAALILLLVSRPRAARAGFVAAGVMIGVLGITHAHTLLTALALGSFALIADRKRIWWWFLAPAAMIGLPIVFMILPETSSIRWLAGWVAPAAGQSWPWFWIRNVGLFLPLFALLSLFGGVPERIRRLTMPLWLWFIVPNMIAFHPWDGNNTKYFLYWQLAGSLMIASWMSQIWSSARQRSTWKQPVAQFGVAILVVIMVSAGTLDTFRSMQRSTAIPWVSNDDVAAAEWLRENSNPDDVIVYGMSNTSAIAALGGRRAVSGRDGWTYDLGLEDWSDRWTATRSILAGGNDAGDAVRRFSVDFVAIGPLERNEHQASDDYWKRNGVLVFSSGDYQIYATS
jgi:hypothetical protein